MQAIVDNAGWWTPDDSYFDIEDTPPDAPCTADAPCVQCRHLDAVPEDEPVKLWEEAA